MKRTLPKKRPPCKCGCGRPTEIHWSGNRYKLYIDGHSGGTPKKISHECLGALLDEGFNIENIANACNMTKWALHRRLERRKKVLGII